MGMGWHEWPLMVFTVLGQIVVGAFGFIALALIGGRMDAALTRRVQMSMFFLWVLMGIAFVASVMHLGSPLRAFNSLNRIGSSALSNEIAVGSLFFALGGFYWLLAALQRLPKSLGNLWLLAATLVGLGFVYVMCRVYAIDTVPTWNNPYTPLNFVMTMLIGGPLLAYLLLGASGVTIGKLRLLPLVSLLAALISIGAALMQSATLASIYSSVHQAVALIPAYGELLVLRLALLTLGLGLWIIPLLKGYRPTTLLLCCSFIAVVIAELIGRAVFYGLHMTVGVVAGG